MTDAPESLPPGPTSTGRREKAFLGALVLVAVLLHVRLILFYGSTVRGWDGRWYYLPVRSAVYLSWLAAMGGLIYLNLCWWSWWFGQAFGARSYLELTPGAVLGLAWLFSRRSAPVRVASLLLAGVGVLWTLGLHVLAYRDGLGQFPTSFGEGFERIISIF